MGLYIRYEPVGDYCSCIPVAQVNVLGLCVCTREFMTQLKERGVNDGHIFLLNRLVVLIRFHYHDALTVLYLKHNISHLFRSEIN